jgi:chromosome segregation protein
VLSEPEEEVQAGISIAVSLPRKKIRGLEALSGGERALTSIALIFSMTQVNPPPFLILDETDAALDEANSKRYADMIRELGAHSQLIVITHNRATMAAAGELFGVTMGGDGVSKLLSVKLEDAERVAK